MGQSILSGIFNVSVITVSAVTLIHIRYACIEYVKNVHNKTRYFDMDKLPP